MKKKNYIWIYSFLLPTTLIFVVLFLIPIITVFITGFTDWSGLESPKFVGFDNYIKIFTYDKTFLVSLKNLFLWSIIAIFVHVPFGAIVALILYKKPFGWKFVRGVFMIPNVIAVSVWAIIYTFMFTDSFGFINNFIRAIGFKNFRANWFFEGKYSFTMVTFTWVFFAVIITLIVLGDLMSIPDELHEAAKVDGATGSQITRFIDLPLIRGSLGIGVILSVLGRITMFENIYLTTKGGPGIKTYNISLMLYEGVINYEFGYANAVASIMVILGIGVLVITRKLFKMDKSTYGN